MGETATFGSKKEAAREAAHDQRGCVDKAGTTSETTLSKLLVLLWVLLTKFRKKGVIPQHPRVFDACPLHRRKLCEVDVRTTHQPLP